MRERRNAGKPAEGCESAPCTPSPVAPWMQFLHMVGQLQDATTWVPNHLVCTFKVVPRVVPFEQHADRWLPPAGERPCHLHLHGPTEALPHFEVVRRTQQQQLLVGRPAVKDTAGTGYECRRHRNWMADGGLMDARCTRLCASCTATR